MSSYNGDWMSAFYEAPYQVKSMYIAHHWPPPEFTQSLNLHKAMRQRRLDTIFPHMTMLSLTAFRAFYLCGLVPKLSSLSWDCGMHSRNDMTGDRADAFCNSISLGELSPWSEKDPELLGHHAPHFHSGTFLGNGKSEPYISFPSHAALGPYLLWWWGIWSVWVCRGCW